MLITEKIVDLVLNLLQVPKIQEAIQKICQNGVTERTKSSFPQKRTAPASYGSPSSFSDTSKPSMAENQSAKMDELKKQVQTLQETLSEAQGELRQAQLQNRRLEAEKSQLQTKLESEQRKSEEANSNARQFETELKKTQEDIENGKSKLAASQNETKILAAEVKRLRNEVSNWENTLGKAMEAFKAFHSLSEETRESIENIFKSDDLTSFIVSGSKWENFIAVWDYARYEFNQGRLKHRDNLLCMLRFFLEIHNTAFYSNPKYSWQQIDIDDDFDDELCMKTQDSRASGSVQKILLHGIVDNENENIVKRSLVIV